MSGLAMHHGFANTNGLEQISQRLLQRSWACVLTLACLVAVFMFLAPSPGFAQTTSGRTGPSAAPAPDGNDYMLARGDKIRIAVFGHADLGGEFDIDSSGNINYPLLGTVTAQGLRVEELRMKIQEDLDRDYIVNPRVSLEVLNFRPFFIMGQINRPGQYPYTSGMLIRQAVALAGGYTRRADNDDIRVIRRNGDQEETFTADENTIIMPGDTINVLRRLF